MIPLRSDHSLQAEAGGRSGALTVKPAPVHRPSQGRVRGEAMKGRLMAFGSFISGAMEQLSGDWDFTLIYEVTPLEDCWVAMPFVISPRKAPK